MPDITPLYLTEKEVAQLLRRGVDWLRQHSEQLERQYGFPKVDPAVGWRHRQAIEMWALERNTRKSPSFSGDADERVNWEAF